MLKDQFNWNANHFAVEFDQYAPCYTCIAPILADIPMTSFEAFGL
jgi:hypothetical protein